MKILARKPTSLKSAVSLLGALLYAAAFLPCQVIEARLEDEMWTITAYCACKKCCGKDPSHPAYGITASGKKAAYGMVAGNWLKFGTKVRIGNLGVFVVADRGAKSLFGSKTNKIKHLDIYFPTHAQAKQFGVKKMEVTIL